MVATVGSIAVDLTVNGAKFEAGFKKAGTTVERESARMAKAVGLAQKSFTGLIGAFGGIGGIGALAGIASFSGALAKARQALADFDDIAKQSRLTGLSTDMFQALSFGALEAGVSQEKLNSALEVFAKNVGLAKSGNGALVSGLKELNPELLKNILAAKSQEERIKLVADAMNQLGSASSRAALASVVFNKGGIEMVEVLGKGAVSIDDFMTRAKELGLVISRDMLEAAGEMDDKLAIIERAISINLSAALVNLGPVLLDAANGMLTFSKEVAAGAAALNEFVNDPSLATFEKFLKSTFGINPHLIEGGPADRFRDWATESKKTAVSITADIEAIKSQIEALEAMGITKGGGNLLQLKQLREEYAALRVQLAFIDEPIKEIGDAAETAGDKVKDLSKDIEAIPDADSTIRITTVYDTIGGPVSVTKGNVGGTAASGEVNLALPPGGGRGGGGGTVSAPPTSISVPSQFNESLLDAMQYDIGFASGGMIHGGDSQPVQFFKSPNEAVGVFTPAQMDAIGNAMGGTTVNMGGITVNVPPGSEPMAPQSQLALLDAVERRVRQALSRP